MADVARNSLSGEILLFGVHFQTWMPIVAALVAFAIVSALPKSE